MKSSQRKQKKSEVSVKSPNAVMQRFAECITEWSGASGAFLSAVAVVLLWAVLGPVFRYSDTWQLVINTGTTIVTFLMVFLIQRTQNKDNLAIQLKLNELLASSKGSNRLIAAESLSEEELCLLRAHYCHMVELWKKDIDFQQAHSIEEAEARHAEKAALKRRPT
jgi:low affinity Fe/Cu permease